MSAQKRRNILVGFGAVAIVLAVAVAYFAPNFTGRDADARGAIGAVQKHRAPQITEGDVVLGDEQTKQEQQILYADFLADAAALQNISAELASDSLSLDVRAESAGRQLAMRQAELQTRYRLVAVAFLEALQRLGAEDQLGRAAFQDLAVRVQQQLAAREMQALSSRFTEVVGQLAIGPCCGKTLKALNVQEFESALASAEQLDTVANVSRLQSAFDADALGSRIRANAAYLDALATEVMTLDAVSRGLLAKSFDDAALGRFSTDLMKEADQLETRARLNIELSLANDIAALEAVSRIEHQLNIASESLDASSRRSLSIFAVDLENRAAEMRARSSAAVRAQLAAIDQHVASREQLGRRSAYLASAMGESTLAVFARDLATRSNALNR
ncbi:MAG TPA: hypothetical protein VNA04_16450 [Thermoanaerobaculia bacterium]|nr:hypothetical protein [Thermoanaerobaculia bacterium]